MGRAGSPGRTHRARWPARAIRTRRRASSRSEACRRAKWPPPAARWTPTAAAVPPASAVTHIPTRTHAHTHSHHLRQPDGGRARPQARSDGGTVHAPAATSLSSPAAVLSAASPILPQVHCTTTCTKARHAHKYSIGGMDSTNYSKCAKSTVGIRSPQQPPWLDDKRHDGTRRS